MKYERFLELAAITPPVVVLGRFLNQNAIGIARDLGRRGVPVLIMDCTRTGHKVPSRYAAKILGPDPHHDEAGFLDALQGVGAQLPQKAVLFPAGDDYVVPVARAAERLGAGFLLPFAGGEVMARANDKWQQIEGAHRAGVDVPQCVYLRSARDLDNLNGQVAFPAILKPAVPQAGRRHLGAKLVPVGGPALLSAAYEMARVCGPLLLQEYIPGADEDFYYLGSYLDAHSQPLAVFTGRRLRQYPRGQGSTRIAESVWMPEVADAGLRLLQELQYHGISHVEFKRDPRDGYFKLMEINTRHYGTHSLAAACGVDLSATAYADALGRPRTAARQREGVRWLHGSADVVASARELLHGELSAREWLGQLRGVRLDGKFLFDDPLPGMADAWHVGARGARLLAARAGAGRL